MSSLLHLGIVHIQVDGSPGLFVLEPMFHPGGEFHNGCGTLGSRLEKERVP
jgi:hypothetical protein